MKALIQKIKKLLRDRRFLRLWSRTISVVAALVVFVTTYALVLPAITMERETCCGIPAHQHTDACFEQQLICTIPESPGHHHDDSCYTTHQELVCQMEEHTHDLAACYDEEGTLVCQLPEHTHDQTACWKDVSELICTMEESDGHQHSDACYENVLVCGMEVHTHSEDCYHNPDEDMEDGAVAAMQDSGDGTGAETPEEGAVFETCEDFVEDAPYESSDPNGEEGLPVDDGTGIPNDDAFLNEEGLPGGEGLPSDEGIEGMTAGQEMEGGGDGVPGQGTDGNPDAAVDENGNLIGDPDADAANSDGYSPADGEQNGSMSGDQNTTGPDAADLNAADPNAPQETAEAAQGVNGGELDPAANTYVPNLAPIDFAGVLSKRTGIYYYAVQEGETVEDSSSISGWKKIEKNTELGPNDLLRVYLSYTIPAGSLNKTNPTAVYRLPANLRLTDAQVNAINAVENGIAAQYIDYKTLTLTDPDNYHRYLGAEAIEGTRKPDQDLNEYLKEHAADGGEAQEFISATVRVENVYGTESSSGDGDSLLCQNLIFTFSPYTIEKNQHTYDASGQPTGAGEKVRGWFTLDFNLTQVSLGELHLEETADAGSADAVNMTDGTENGTDPAAETEGRLVRVIRNAEIVFAEEDQTRGLEEISARITVVTGEELVKTGENPADGNDHPEETDESNENHENDENIEETAGIEETEKPVAEGTGADEADVNEAEAETKKEKTDEEKEAELKEALASMMPAMSFEDSIRVHTGKPAGVVEGEAGSAAASAAEALPRKAKVTVRVEADEGTFPVGTTMVLSAVDDLDAVAETVRDAVENGAAGEAPENGEATDTGSDHTTGSAEKTNTANAASAANNPKTYGFQAVDISFRDADGNEIEPAKPVRVALTSEIVEQIKRDKEADETNAIADPVVVHVDDKGNAEKMNLIAPEEIEPAQGRTEEEIREALEKEAEETAATQDDKEKEAVERDSTEEATASEEQVVGDKDAENDVPAEEHQTQEPAPSGESSVFFETESFSIYAIVYTVDFHYEVNGKMYEFSLPGGGFVSFTDLVEVLGIIGEKSTVITLDDVEVSEATRIFVADVDSVEFSNPELMYVGKADTDTTVGQIKEDHGLVCEYSADLTEEQIAEINAQTVDAGDWALISMQPFTSEETLTVTMKNGEVFTIRVTDYQIIANVLTADGKNYKIVVTYDDDAEIPEGTKLNAVEIDPDSDAFIQRLGQAWYEVNKEYFEVEEMRMHYNEGMGDLPDVHLVNLDEVRFFDISLVYEGKAIEPAAPVHVDITYVDGLEISEGSIAGVVHFAESGVELIKDVETTIKDNAVTGFSYEQAGFSDTGTYVGRETFDEAGGPAIAPAPGKTEYPLLKAAADSQDGETMGRKGETDDAEDPADLERPKGTKTLIPNTASNGGNDGTYTLTLSVSGTSKSSTETIVSKSNVLIVMDRSSSMINNYVYTYTEHTGSYQNGTTYYGKNGETYFQLFYNNGNGRYYRNYNQYGYPRYSNEYTGTRYTGTRKTRLAEEQTALSQLLNQLLSKNGTGTTADGVSLEDIIEVSVISFADQRYSGKDTEVGWTTDYDTLMAGVNKGTYTSGTNWEDALKYALEVANAKQAQASQEGEEMHIIFLTDGEPTAVYGESGGAYHYTNSSGIAIGDGFGVAYNAAKDDAMTLVNVGYHLYNIFTYGTDEDYGYMVRLTNYAYSNGENDTTNEDTNAVKQYFTNAKTTDKLLSAFQNIFSLVSNHVAYGKVSITDGLTTDAMTTTLVNGQTEGYKYVVAGALGELYSVTATGDVDNPTVTFTINGHDYPGEKKSTTISGVSYDYWSYTVGEGDAAVEYKMTLADVSHDGTLTWDLTGIGTLMDGYTYSASFVVWPDQDAYDYVAALNNGLPGYTWDTDADTYEDLRTSKGYEKGGVENFPSIVRYENGTFAVLTNTDQKVQYSIVETKEVDGETTVEYDGPYEFDLPTPAPMPLIGTASQLEKVWNVNRDPSILYKYLYESKDKDDNPLAIDIGFVIVQDGEEYKEIHLPGNATVTEEGVSYDWSAYDPDDLVEYNGKIFSKRWSREFSIPTGLMLSAAQMEARSLDKSLYTGYSFGGTQYYVLEAGHDFMISEPSVGYEFDFEAPTYHPMLVDGVLMDVKFSTEGGTKHISGMEALEIDTGTGKSALSVFNTLRGYINLKKKVIDQVGTMLETDDTEFIFEVELINALPVFEGDSIPWYGINGLYYHDVEGNYYQAEYINGELQVTTEDGGPYPANGTAFNPDIVDEQTVTYIIDGEEKSVTISGNQMTPGDGNEDDGYKKVRAEIKITQAETLYIANVPVNTQYSIQEILGEGYQLVGIERNVGSGAAAAAGSMDTGIVEGEIVQNTETLITYTNKCLITDITIQKTDPDGEGLAGAVFQLKKVGSNGHSESDAALITSVSGLTTVSKTVDGEIKTYTSAFESDGSVQTINGLPDGTYRLYEMIVPAGYITTFRYVEFTIENRELKDVKTNANDTEMLDFTEASGNHLALLKVTNPPGAALPNTGGPGTLRIYLTGLLLTALAGLCLWGRREYGGSQCE